MKPASVRRIDLINKLANDINESGLPPYVIEPILADLLRQAREMTEKQYQADCKAWQEEQEKKDAIKDIPNQS